MSDDEPKLIDLVVKGAAATIAYCRATVSADFEGRRYVDSLSESDQKKFHARFIHLAGRGHLANPEQFRHEGDGIWFIKIDGHRLACFKQDKAWILLTSGSKKDPKDKGRKQQVEYAKRIRDAYLAAQPGGK